MNRPPTAKGTRFLTLEDERSFINVILHESVYEQHRRTIRASCASTDGCGSAAASRIWWGRG